MKNLLALTSLALLIFGTVGYFRGWYKFQTNANENGGRTFNVDVNTSKFSEDMQHGKDRLRHFLTSEDSNKSRTQQANNPQQPQHPQPPQNPQVVQQPPQQQGWWPQAQTPTQPQQQQPMPQTRPSNGWWPTITTQPPQQQQQPQGPQATPQGNGQRPGFFQVQLPQIHMPQVKLPQVQFPQVQVPQVQVPQPGVRQSQWWPVNPQPQSNNPARR